jgi:hypothetical protein
MFQPRQAVLTRAPGNDGAIGGWKVMAESGWFAARSPASLGRPRGIPEAEDAGAQALHHKPGA